MLYLSLRKSRSTKSHNYHDAMVFKKLCFQNVFRSHENKNPCVYNFLDESFRKAPFSLRITVHGRSNRRIRNKVAFTNFSAVVWTLPNDFSSMINERQMRDIF